MSSKVG